MKKTYILALITFAFILESAQVLACPPPRYSFRGLTIRADLIIGVQVNQLQNDAQSYPIHQVIKGEYTSSIMYQEVPWELTNNTEGNVYAILFLKKNSETNEYYNLWADNDVLQFKTMAEAEYSVQRFKELTAYLEQPNKEVLVIEWLTKSIDIGQHPQVTNRYLRNNPITKQQWFYDAVDDMSQWFYKAQLDEKSHRYRKLFFIRSEMGLETFLDYIQEAQKERIFKQFRNAKEPGTSFLILVKKLGIKGIQDQLFELLYQSLENNDEYEIKVYSDALTEEQLTPTQQNYFAKLLLFDAKANILPVLKSSSDSWYYNLEGLNYAAKISFSQPFQVAAKSWANYLDKNTPNQTTLQTLYQNLVIEAEKHINMCDDWRINKLTGKRKLWTCAEESAFAKAKAFEEGSIETSIYPNPNNGKFTVQLTLEKGQPVFLELLALDGKSVSKHILTAHDSDISHYYFQQQMQLENLKKGLYLLSIQQGNRVITEKVLVE